MALVGHGNRAAIIRLAKDPAVSVRLASLLAMRRLGMAEIAQFLNDADPKLVVEAARAINDQPIDQALPQLAALIGRTGMSEPLLWRVVNANYRLKDKANADALAKFAGRSNVPDAIRLEALDCLLTWDEPRVRDRVVGLYRPVPSRPAKEAADAVRANLGTLFTSSPQVRALAAKVAAKFGIKEVGPALFAVVADAKQTSAVRVESLKALTALMDKELTKAMKLALADGDPRVRTEGRRILVKLEPKEIVAELENALNLGEVIDRQGAFAILADLKQPEAAAILEKWLDGLLTDKIPPEVRLDLLEAAAKHKNPALAKKIAQHEAARSPKDHLAKWAETLHGGDADNGKRIFFERSEVSCLRCHKVQGNGGEVGPDLTGIGAKQKRDYLLESLVDPDKQIAQGYETVVITLLDGKTRSGILKSEDKKEVRADDAGRHADGGAGRGDRFALARPPPRCLTI